MSEQNMRGMRLGATSLETARGAGLEPRQKQIFVCDQGHESEVVFSIEADLPNQWECKLCGKPAGLKVSNKVSEVVADEDSGRSHWQMLLERRSIPELEEILQERLEYLQERRSRAS